MSSQQSFQALSRIWEHVSRPQKDGKRAIFFPSRDDIVYLYCTGFVDESQYRLKQWLEAFADSLQKDGSYLVTETQWMDKVQYHYSGPVGTAFDAMLIREGDWTEKEMERLIESKLLPAVYFTRDEFMNIFNEAKPTFYKEGHYQISPAVKKDLKELIDMYPSPAQVRAMGILEARMQGKTLTAQPKGQQAPSGTGFAQGPAPSQVAAQRLASILGKTGGK